MRPHPSPLLSPLFLSQDRPTHTLPSVLLTAKSLLTFGSAYPPAYWASPQDVPQHLRPPYPQLTGRSLPDFILLLYALSQGMLSTSTQLLKPKTWGSYLTCFFLSSLSYESLNSSDSTPRTAPKSIQDSLPRSVFALLQLLLYSSPSFQSSIHLPLQPKGSFKRANW